MIKAVLFAAAMSAYSGAPGVEPVEPSRITTHPAEEYMPAISPDGKLLAFVSSQGGAPNIWVKTINSPEIPTPRRLTNHPAGNKSPCFSPDGKTLVFTSYSTDAEGDLYRVTLPRLREIASFNPTPERLTGVSTADKEPAFTPSGDTIIFTSADKGGGRENLWKLNLKTLERKQLTFNGGSEAAVSPSGGVVVYVSRKDDMTGALRMLNLYSGAETVLTSGEYNDLFPVFIDWRHVAFTRYADDTNNDGVITLDDNPSLYMMDIFEKDKPPLPLTTAENYNLFPASTAGQIYFSTKQGDAVDVYRLPATGMAPPLGSLAKDVKRARDAEKYFRDRPRLALLYWREAWAANSSDADKTLLAECLYRVGLAQKNLGSPKTAAATFASVAQIYPNEKLYSGLSELEKTVIQARLSSADFKSAIEKIDTVAKKYESESRVAAKANIEKASFFSAGGKSDEAVKILRKTIAEYSALPDVAAEAAFRRNEIYLSTGEREKLTEVYVDVITSFPGQDEWRDKAINRILDLNVTPGDIVRSSTSLNSAAEKYSSVPVLAAAALNRIGDIYVGADELAKARDAYARTVARFPDESREKNEALFKMARIYAEREEYAKALELYKSIEQDTGAKREIYEKSRREFIRQSLKKGEFELNGGEARIALKTFISVLENDPTSTEAHRWIIRVRAALNEGEKSVKELEAKLKGDPNNDLYMYALGLALTYTEKPPFEKAEKLIKSAVSKNERNPWYHQTLGWIYEQKELFDRSGANADLALQEYSYAYALTDFAEYPEREADLLLNMGNVNYLLNNFAEARENYSDRAALSTPFSGAAVESLFHQRWGECEFKLGADDEAVKHLAKAAELAEKGEAKRKIEIYERIGLAYQSAGKWDDAARAFLESIKLRRESGAHENEIVTLRNVANNLYFASQSADKNGAGKMREALKYYLESEAALDRKVKVESKNGPSGGALVKVEIETGVGGVRGASKGFSEDDEKKLIYHHIGKIYGELGDYKKAAEYFEKKLKMVPAALTVLGNVPVLTEKSIILNQLGGYLAKLGDGQAAIKRLDESLAICLKLENVNGAVTNAAEMTRLAVMYANSLPEDVTQRAALRAGEALNLAESKGAGGSETAAKTMNRLAQIYHARYAAKSRLPAPKIMTHEDAASYAVATRLTATDFVKAVKLYEKASTGFEKIHSATGFREYADTEINRARLLASGGYEDKAAIALSELEKKAEKLFFTDVIWKAKYARASVEESPFASDSNRLAALTDAARVLESIPFGGANSGGAASIDMARALYGDIAALLSSSGKNVEAMAAANKGLDMAVKMTLSELSRANGSGPFGKIDGLASKRDLLLELFAGESSDDDDTSATRNRKMAEWKKEYDAEIERLAKSNPLLSDIVKPKNIDVNALRAALGPDEAVVFIWPVESGVKAASITRSLMNITHETSLAETVAKYLDGGVPGAGRIYFVTSHPFTDPALSKPRDRAQAAAVPSLTSIIHYKGRMNINDFNLILAGSDSPAAREASEGFAETELIYGDIGVKNLSSPGALSPGILLFTREPAIAAEELLPEFDLRDNGSGPQWLPQARLPMAEMAGALLISPPVDAKGRSGWESAAATMGLLAGYPSWIVAPKHGAVSDAFVKALLAGTRLGSAADALDNAISISRGEGRLIGAFGFSEQEKAEQAKKLFADRIRAGASAIRAENWAGASIELRQALVYTSLAGISKYEDSILDKLAEAEFRKGDYRQSLVYQERLNAILRKKKDQVKLADALIITGAAQARLGMTQEAVDSMNEALRIYKDKGMLDKMAIASSRLGLAEEGFARYGRALEAYGAALSIERKSGDEINALSEIRRIGRIYHLRLNQFDKARAAYGEAMALYKKHGDAKNALMTMIDLGAVEEDAGNLDEAEKLFTGALAEAEKLKDEKAAALADFHLANVNWFRGDYEPAFNLIRSSIKKGEESKDFGQAAVSLNTLGLVYWSLNDNLKALEIFEKSAAMAKKAGLRLDVASALNNTGLVYRGMGETDKSINYFTAARSMDEELKSDWGVAYDSRNLSISLLIKGDLEGAEKYAKEAVELTSKIGDRVNSAKARLQLAEVWRAKKMPDTAIAQFNLAYEQAVQAGVKEVQWRSLRGEGRSLVDRQDREKALDKYRQAVEIVEGMRAAIKANELKSGFLDDKQDLYEEIILLLLDKGLDAEAFSYAERARSRSFIDLLGSTRIKLKDAKSQKEYEKVIALKRKLDEAQKDKPQSERDKLAGELAAEIRKIRSDNPDLVPFITVEPVSANDVARLMDDSVSLIEYVVTPKELVIFVVGNGGVKARRNPIDKKELEKSVLELRKLIQEGAPLSERPRALGRILLDPVKDLTEKAKTLAIAPHGILHYLSFAALDAGDGYLVDRKALFYVPAASVFEYTVKRRRNVPVERMKALAVGDPDLGDTNTELPLSGFEAQSLKWVFPRADIYVRGQATEGRVTKNALEYGILHIASHGQFDPVNPLMSGLYLKPDNGGDGVLRAREIFSMSVNADLVTLSACQTGLGKVTSGDELIGLNRAFFYSGAHAILSTLWRVDDAASAVLVKHFYRNLPTDDKAEALRKAQLLIKRRYPHPAFWAGFTLSGDYK